MWPAALAIVSHEGPPGESELGSALFASTRERRLWLWAATVVLGIYSTLGPAQALAEWLREHNLIRLTGVAALILVLVALGSRWLRNRPGWLEIAAAIGVVGAYALVLLRVAVPEERTHLIEYSVVAALVYQALNERRRRGRRVPAPPALALVATVLVGWLDEGIQAFLPNRFYDWIDVLFNSLAALMAIGATLSLRLARRVGRRLKS